MRLFRFWTKEQCTEAILALEEGIATGAQSIQYPSPSGGGMAFTSLSNATTILDHLYRRVDELDGKRRRKNDFSFIRFIPKRGW